MSSTCDQLAAYVDGQLDAAQTDTFSHHLTGCAACRNELHDVLQLAALETTARAHGPRRDAAVPRRRWRRGALAAVAAAAVVLLVVWLRRGTTPIDDKPLVLAIAEVRAMEGRISYTAADKYRPYDVARAGSASGALDAVSLDTLARLEHRGDLHGIAAAYLLMKDTQRAAAYLERATPSPDVASDRALVLRAGGHPSDALIALDAVLAAAPHHAQALWNRALVLRDLGLPLSAAETFKAVAALNEPGWAEEARERAKALSDQANESATALQRLALEDGPQLATTPGAVTPEVARRFPGMARLQFYNAVRSVTSAEAVRALTPLARTLDSVYGGDALLGYIERISHADFTRRAPLARRYAALVRGQRLDDAEERTWFAALRAAHQPDILFGAIVLARSGHVPPAEIPELRRLAEDLHDRWFDLLAVEQAAGALLSEHDYTAAEALLLPALASCEARPLDYRCANLDSLLGEIYLITLRLPDMRRVIAEGLARAQRAGEWYLEQELLERLTRLESVQDDVVGSTLPLVRAYAGEVVLREPKRCDLVAWYHEQVALMMVSRLDFARASEEVAQIAAMRPTCPSLQSHPSLQSEIALAETKAHLLRTPGSAASSEVTALREEIAALRAIPSLGTGDRAALDQIEGRLLIDRDRTAGTALLERAISVARPAREDDVNARRARSYAYSILTLDAGRAGEWDRVWSLLGAEAGFTPVPRCALGAAVEDHTSLVVVRDTAGVNHGVFDAAAPGPAVNAATLVPTALRDALRGCTAVEVVALPPVQGLPGILPADLAWSYRVGAGAPAEPAPGHPRRVVIAEAEPPAALGLPRLLPWHSTTPPDVVLSGPAATPSHALAELVNASFVEIHAHGMMKATVSDASFLMLSPEADGRYALTAGAIRRQPLRGHPIVILAACHAAVAATYRHEAWSLPAAFLAAGARAVIASTDVISDAGAGAFFDDVRARIEHGEAPAIALRDARSQWLAASPSASWTRSLMVFQ